MSGLFQMRGHRLVRRQHELFDDAMSDVARAARDAGHHAVLVEFDQRLGQIEINRSALIRACAAESPPVRA